MTTLLAAVVVLGGCGLLRPSPLPGPPREIASDLPLGFPPPIESGEGSSPELAELGRHLFYDVRLSGNRTTSCGSCHRQALAFTDGRARALGSTGQLHPRSAMSLANVVYNATLTWADPGVTELPDQALVPMLNQHPVELGVAGREPEVAERFVSDPWYAERFRNLFPRENVDLRLLARAIAAFERTLLSGNAPYDRFVFHDEPQAMPDAARRGMRLFFSERLGCARCHSGFNFSGPVKARGATPQRGVFHNTGLYNLGGQGLYPATDLGLHRITRRKKHIGRFRAPTLRNIAVTAPYMHDGSIATLEEVIDHYAQGGRAGKDNPLKDPLVRGFDLTDQERLDLVQFLESLTDEGFLTDPRFADPFAGTSAAVQKSVPVSPALHAAGGVAPP